MENTENMQEHMMGKGVNNVEKWGKCRKHFFLEKIENVKE